MNCPTCNGPMHLEEVLTHRTTSPEEDDQYQDMWLCNNDECGDALPAEEGTHE